MTTIKVNIKGRTASISCENHAENEAVCAGISAICYALVGWSINNTEHCTDLTYEMSPGHFVWSSGLDDIGYAAFEMAVIGLSQIEENEDNAEFLHVSINEDE